MNLIYGYKDRSLCLLPLDIKKKKNCIGVTTRKKVLFEIYYYIGLACYCGFVVAQVLHDFKTSPILVYDKGSPTGFVLHRLHRYSLVLFPSSF